jgi:hypothetical protein
LSGEGFPAYATDISGRLKLMQRFVEKFTIKVTDSGVLMTDKEGNCIRLTAGEALMLLDILRNEEAALSNMAEKASPLPLHIHI